METNPGSEIVEERYSVHDSDRSPNYSTLHFTQICRDGRKIDSALLTDAIKRKTGFALIFGVAAGSMVTPFYALRPTDRSKIINIGHYDPKLFSFFYAVAIGPVDAIFSSRPRVDLSFQQIKFQRYSLVLLWSFASMPAPPISTHAHVQTFPPESAKTEVDAEFLRSLMSGSNARETCDGYLQMRNDLLSKQIQKICKWVGKSEEAMEQRLKIMTGHFKSAASNSTDYIKFLNETAPKLRAFEASISPRDRIRS